MSAKDAFIARAVGSPVQRVEDLRLLRGRGQYIDDLHCDGMLHAAVLRSNVAHGLLKSIAAENARAMPGVHAVFTARDIAAASGGAVPTIPLRLLPMKEMEPFEQPVMALERVRYVGEPIALVVAESPALAEDALDAISVEIEPLPPVADRHAAQAKQTLLYEKHGSNCALVQVAAKGNAESVRAPYVRRESFRVQRHTAVALEPRGVLAQWNGAATRLTVSGAAKVPFSTRRMIARCMDLPEECIDVMENDVGGGFGVRGEFYPEDFLVPFAARKLNRPVKWIEDRRENLLGSNHAREIDCDIEIACEKDGTIVALRAQAWVDMGAYLRTSAMIPPRVLAQGLSGPYRIAHVRVEASMMLTNKAPVGTYRGPGRFEGNFCRERLFDMAANDLGLDPAEFRRRNLVRPAEMPYEIPTLQPFPKPDHLDGGDNGATFERCLREIGYQKKRELQGKLVDGRYHGIGLGCFIEGGAAGPRENVRFEVEPDGSVTLYSGSANVGQSMETSALQIASDALGFPMEKLRVLHGSTNLVKEGFGAFHARCVVVGGSAIVDAAAKLKEAIRAAAAPHLGCAAADVGVGEGLAASYGAQTLGLAKLASLVPARLGAEGTFVPHHYTYAYGSAAAHVAVDPKTGHVQLLDYVTVEDVGRVINPLTLQGQVIGATVQGLGGVFLEHLVYDPQAQFLSGSLADYLLPTATDFPAIRAVMTGEHASPNNPLGAKGGADGGICPVAGVIGNAVAAALAPLGVRVTELPLSPSRLWESIQAASRKIAPPVRLGPGSSVDRAAPS